MASTHQLKLFAPLAVSTIASFFVYKIMYQQPKEMIVEPAHSNLAYPSGERLKDHPMMKYWDELFTLRLSAKETTKKIRKKFEFQRKYLSILVFISNDSLTTANVNVYKFLASIQIYFEMDYCKEEGFIVSPKYKKRLQDGHLVLLTFSIQKEFDCVSKNAVKNSNYITVSFGNQKIDVQITDFDPFKCKS